MKPRIMRAATRPTSKAEAANFVQTSSRVQPAFLVGLDEVEVFPVTNVIYIAVGAGLRLQGLRESPGLVVYITVVKLVAVPAAVLGVGVWLGLSGLQLQIAVMFGALPTASSAYILAQRMGGNGAFMNIGKSKAKVYVEQASTLILVGTLASVVTVTALLYAISVGIAPR